MRTPPHWRQMPDAYAPRQAPCVVRHVRRHDSVWWHAGYKVSFLTLTFRGPAPLGGEWRREERVFSN